MMRSSQVCVAFFALLLSGCASYWSSSSKQARFIVSEPQSAPGIRGIPIVRLGVESGSERVADRLKSRAEQAESGFDLAQRSLVYADLGLSAFYNGNMDLAERYLDESIGIATGYTEAGKRERRATSLTGSESDKVFKGEPHERAFIFFVRGLLYLGEGDIDNAHACFQSGAVQDSMAEYEQSRGDWLSHDLLILYCKNRWRSEDRHDWRQYIENRYSGELSSNWETIGEKSGLLIVFVGPPPTKIAAQSKGQQLRYVEQESIVNALTLETSYGESRRISRADNIYIQAATRGTRDMDAVLASQAKTRTAIETVGTIAAVAGQASGGTATMLAGALIKEASLSASESIDSSADIRQVRSLPGSIFILPFDANVDETTVLRARDFSTLLAETPLQSVSPIGPQTILCARIPY